MILFLIFLHNVVQNCGRGKREFAELHIIGSQNSSYGITNLFCKELVRLCGREHQACIIVNPVGIIEYVQVFRSTGLWHSKVARSELEIAMRRLRYHLYMSCFLGGLTFEPK